MRHDVQIDAELGVRTFACVRGQRSAPCSVCGRAGSRLCDGLKAPLVFGADPVTCDASLCQGCSTPGAGGADLCPACVRSRANRAVAP